MIKHKLFSDKELGAQLIGLGNDAKALHARVTVLVLDALLSYHHGSYSCGRCEQVYAALAENKLRSHITAFEQLIRMATAITGQGEEPGWKGAGAKGRLSGAETPWEQVLEDLERDGIQAYLPAKKAKAQKIKQDKAGNIKVPEGTDVSVKNAVQKQMDELAEKPVDEALAILAGNKAGAAVTMVPSVLDKITHPDLREAMELMIDQALAMQDIKGLNGKGETAAKAGARLIIHQADFMAKLAPEFGNAIVEAAQAEVAA